MEYSVKNFACEAYGHSIICYSKERNGDHLILEDITTEKILVAIVADGITNRPCDWLASELTCSKFLDGFYRYKSLPINRRITESINLANNHLLSAEEKCHGLASTMSLLVWAYESHDFSFVNIGDSRIYKVNDSGIHCLTRDDAHKGLQTIYTSIGKRTIESSKITNYMGYISLHFNIQNDSFHQGELLLLASDGFYDARKSSFEERLIALGRSTDLQSDFNELIKKFEISARDDMTAIVIRRLKN